MAGIFPSTGAGGVVFRDEDGCLYPAGVTNAYCPGDAFNMTCNPTALPDDCTARILPAQINALMSELLALGEAFDPDGTWRCTANNNLATLFGNWQDELMASLDVCNFEVTDPSLVPVLAPVVCDLNGDNVRVDLWKVFYPLTGGDLLGNMNIKTSAPSITFDNLAQDQQWRMLAGENLWSLRPVGSTTGFELVWNNGNVKDGRLITIPAATVYDDYSIINVVRGDARYQKKLPSGTGYLYNDGNGNYSWSTPSGGGGSSDLPADAPGALTNNGAGGLSWVEYADATVIGDPATEVGTGVGQILIDDETGLMYYWSGGAWVPAGGADLFVKKAGDTMTGALHAPNFYADAKTGLNANYYFYDLTTAANVGVVYWDRASTALKFAAANAGDLSNGMTLLPSGGLTIDGANFKFGGDDAGLIAYSNFNVVYRVKDTGAGVQGHTWQIGAVTKLKLDVAGRLLMSATDNQIIRSMSGDLHFQNSGGSNLGRMSGTAAQALDIMTRALGDTRYSLSSDASLKKNIEDMPDVTDTFMGLRPRCYEWLEGDDGIQFGLVANEVRDTVASAVKGGEKDDPLLRLDPATLIGLLVKMVQKHERLLN